MHFSVCGIIALFVAIIAGVLNAPVFVSAMCGFACGMGTGLGKEYGDKVNPYNIWDWEDVIADTIGSVCGALVAAILLIF